MCKRTHTCKALKSYSISQSGTTTISKSDRNKKDAKSFVPEMAAALQTNIPPVKVPATFRAVKKQSFAPFRVRCAVASPGNKRYNITLLPGDGIGPEVVSIAKNVLQQAGSLEGSLSSSSPLFLTLFHCFVLALNERSMSNC